MLNGLVLAAGGIASPAGLTPDIKLIESHLSGDSCNRGKDQMTEYLADVQKYDTKASAETVNKIVKHLGIALRNKDSSLVAAADQKELDRVKNNWVIKKLGVTDEAKADAAIKKTAAAMSADTSKSRVTFYYLVAKDLGKLASL
jgi:Protein of unknown function (DUF2853)